MHKSKYQYRLGREDDASPAGHMAGETERDRQELASDHRRAPFRVLRAEVTADVVRSLRAAGIGAAVALLLILSLAVGVEHSVWQSWPTAEDSKMLGGVALMGAATIYALVLTARLLFLRERLRGIGLSISAAEAALGTLTHPLGALGRVLPGASVVSESLRDLTAAPQARVQRELNAEAHLAVRLALTTAFGTLILFLALGVGAEKTFFQSWPSAADASLLLGAGLVAAGLACTLALLVQFLFLRARLRGLADAADIAGDALGSMYLVADTLGTMVRGARNGSEQSTDQLDGKKMAKPAGKAPEKLSSKLTDALTDKLLDKLTEALANKMNEQLRARNGAQEDAVASSDGPVYHV